MTLYPKGRRVMPKPCGLRDGSITAMISPVTKFPIRGAVWCQGEGNAGAAYKYPHIASGSYRRLEKSVERGQFPVYCDSNGDIG